jgi:hypothetical protein
MEGELRGPSKKRKRGGGLQVMKGRGGGVEGKRETSRVRKGGGGLKGHI